MAHLSGQYDAARSEPHSTLAKSFSKVAIPTLRCVLAGSVSAVEARKASDLQAVTNSCARVCRSIISAKRLPRNPS